MYPINQQGSQFQSNNMQQPFQSGHYVQSHYQGQLSQPSFGQPGVIPSGYQSNSHFNQGSFSSFGGNQHYQQYTPQSQALGPVISRVGWQAGPDLHQQHQMHQQYQPQQSHSYVQQANMGGHYAAGPVISHYGYQAGAENRGPVNQVFNQQSNQGHYQPQHFGASHIHTGFTAQSHTGQHPVYESTNAYQQAGPVISHFGGYESNQH